MYSEDPTLKDIVKPAAFELTGKEIAKLRKNMGTLLDILSTLYLAALSENKSTEPMMSGADTTGPTESMSSTAVQQLLL